MTTVVFSSSATPDTVVATLNAAARQCGVRSPTAWITSTNADAVEMRDDFLLQTVGDILDRVDLPYPIAGEETIIGTGVETYDLPGAFRRMQRNDLAVYDKDQDRPCIPVQTDGEYTQIKDLGAAGAVKYYRVKGYRNNYDIDVYLPLATGSEIVVHYITNYWCASSVGVIQDAFLDEADVLLLPPRLVEAGIVWRFRERRGLPYEDKFAEYEAKLARLSMDARGRRSINFGKRNKNVRWQDLVPAFIPSS